MGLFCRPSSHYLRALDLGGDFNIIFYSERSGGTRPHCLSMQETNACVDEYVMMDMPTLGAYFTWCNSQIGDWCIRQRLDRVLFSDRALFVGGFDAAVLHHECSDHALISCLWNARVEESPSRWHFLRLGVLPKDTLNVLRRRGVLYLRLQVSSPFTVSSKQLVRY